MGPCLIVPGNAGIGITINNLPFLRTRQPYYHLREADRAMRDTLDILHNAVIDLA